MAFRELTFEELDQVAGGYWHSYCYYSSGGQCVWDREWIDDTPAPTASADHTFYNVGAASPTAFNEFVQQVEARYGQQPVYSSQYDSGFNFWGSFYQYSNAFDWFDHGLAGFVPADALVGSSGYMPSVYVSNENGNSVSSFSLGGSQFGFTINGLSMVATYHAGAPTTTDPNDNSIVVNGGHWTYGFTGFSEVNSAVQNGIITASPASATQPPVDDYPPGWDYQRDHNIDKLGVDIAKEITDQSDSARVEYRAFIYETPDGVVHRSQLFKGNATEVIIPASSIQFLAGAKILADIHNHPTYLPDGSYNGFAIGTDYGDIRTLQQESSYTIGSNGYSGDYQLRLYIVTGGYVSKYTAVQNASPIPAGDGHTPYPGAVRSGIYPELGQ